MMDKKIVFQGQYIQVLKRDRWEFVERANCSGIVSILALTDHQKIILVEQFRQAVNSKVIELPAGLVADQAEHAEESLAQAAARELYEETGYQAKNLVELISGPPSPGLSDEVMTYFFAQDVEKKGTGGGVDLENIKVHEVPLSEIDQYLSDYRQNHGLVTTQVYTGLYLLGKLTRANRP